ncbi:MAG: hypothetical protein ACK4KV_07485 [Rhodocyclaceae bacterium]
MKLTKIAFGVALAAGTMAAQADSIFFPYVVNGGSVTTIVHVIDSATGAADYYDASGNPGGNRLHYTLVNKSGANATSNSATCGEVNYYLPHSPFDLQSIDLGGRFSVAADKGVLFNDPGVNNNWKPAVSGALTYAMAQAAGGGSAVRGHLIVDNARTGSAASSISGEAMVFEFAGGAAWGYLASTIATDAAADDSAFEFDYSDVALSGVLSGATRVSVGQVSFMPTAETTTRFFVTPLNRNAADAPAPTPGQNDSMHPIVSALYGQYTTQVLMSTSTGVAYDRDENLVSGTVPVTVTCIGAVNVTDLLSPGAAVVLANGGWGQLMTQFPNNAAPTAAQPERTRRAAVIKLDFNNGGTFNGQPASGTYNNAFRL